MYNLLYRIIPNWKIMNKKILLIDDSKTQLNTLKILFKHEGFDVETACDGVEGYQKIFEKTPDIIISDILMPNLTGYQLCRLVKDNPITKDIPIILLTILEQKIDKFWSKKSGADMFLLKSTEFQNIINCVKTILKEKTLSEEAKDKIKKHSYSKGLIQAELNEILDNSLMQATVLNEFRLLAMHLEDESIMAKNLFEMLSSILNFDLAFLVINTPGENEKKIYTGSCLNLEDNSIQKAIYKSVTNIFGKNTEYNVQTVYENWCGTEKLNDNIFQSSYIHQVKYADSILGAICFFCSQDKDLENQKLFHILLKEIDLLITIQSLFAQNKFLSLTDGLTGLYNRRYLMENIEREFARAQRYQKELSIAMIDIDFFKKINDKFGHQAGDFILKEITDIIKQNLRKSDLIFRYGGEEVLAIMPETDKAKALVPLEKIRKQIENKEFVFNDTHIKTSISIGITDTSQDIASIAMFINQADKAMYQAKNNGRNRVELI